MDGTVIIADDDKNLRAVLTQSLTRAGAKVRATATLTTLWRWLEEGEGDVVLCDVNLADGDALDVLPKMRAMRPDLQFVMMSAQNTVITAIRAGEAGAFEYLAKPFDLREMVETLMRAQKQIPQNNRNNETSHSLDLPLLGRSEVMQEVYRKLSKIIASDLPVVVVGEAGSGKSLIAEVIHNYGARKNSPLVKYDGAQSQDHAFKEAFDDAGAGTLILEKLEDLLPSEQREVMQAIESGKYEARLVATSTAQLHQALEDGRFRADLYHHLNVLSLEMPSLRERLEDIEELARAFVEEESQGQKYLSKDALSPLKSRHWPGNVKELQSSMRRLVAMSVADEIAMEDVMELLPYEENSPHIRSGVEYGFSQNVESYIRRFLKLHGDNLPPQGIYSEIMDQVDRPLIEVILEVTGGNQIRTAEILGINRNTLRKKIQNLDISVTKGKKLM